MCVADGMEEGPRVDNLHGRWEVHSLLQLSQNRLELLAELVQHFTKLCETHCYHVYIRCNALEGAGMRGRGGERGGEGEGEGGEGEGEGREWGREREKGGERETYSDPVLQ